MAGPARRRRPRLPRGGPQHRPGQGHRRHQAGPHRAPDGPPPTGPSPLGPLGQRRAAPEPGVRLPLPDGPVLRGCARDRSARVGRAAALVGPPPECLVRGLPPPGPSDRDRNELDQARRRRRIRPRTPRADGARALLGGSVAPGDGAMGARAPRRGGSGRPAPASGGTLGTCRARHGRRQRRRRPRCPPTSGSVAAHPSLVPRLAPLGPLVGPCGPRVHPVVGGPAPHPRAVQPALPRLHRVRGVHDAHDEPRRDPAGDGRLGRLPRRSGLPGGLRAADPAAAGPHDGAPRSARLGRHRVAAHSGAHVARAHGPRGRGTGDDGPRGSR